MRAVRRATVRRSDGGHHPGYPALGRVAFDQAAGAGFFDPYSIALSKIARGFESDLEDVLFMFGSGTIGWAELEQDFYTILPCAGSADIDPEEVRVYFAETQRRQEAGSI